MIPIDGSLGEGGGQILRSALGLSLVTGLPFRLTRIRAGREKPGLLRQHLAAARAAAQLGDAEVSGLEPGSTELSFAPRALKPGDHAFAVGSAGSATLVLQTVLPALLRAGAPSTLLLEGGTHNPWAPSYDFLAKVFLPLLGRMGAPVTSTLARRGYYPAGGGSFSVRIQPTDRLAPLVLDEAGPRRAIRAQAIVSRLDREIARRELQVLERRLSLEPPALSSVEDRDSAGPGNVLTVEVESANVTEVFTAFGEKGVNAETLAGRLADEVEAYLAAGVPVGAHLADQLLIPLALAGAGSFTTLPLSKHATTNMDVIRRFLPVAFDVAGGRVSVRAT